MFLFKAKFKKERWDIRSEKELRELLSSLSCLIRDNGGTLPGKRSVKVIYETDEEEIDASERRIKDRKIRES